MQFIFPDKCTITVIINEPDLQALFTDRTSINYSDFTALVETITETRLGSDDFILIVELWLEILKRHKKKLETNLTH